MLAGYLPFEDDTMKGLFEKIETKLILKFFLFNKTGLILTQNWGNFAM
jgi:hypothetical protein